MTTFRRSVLGIGLCAALTGSTLTGCASQSGYGPGVAPLYADCDEGYCVNYLYGQRYLYLRTPATPSAAQRMPVTVAKHPPAPRPVARPSASFMVSHASVRFSSPAAVSRR